MDGDYKKTGTGLILNIQCVTGKLKYIMRTMQVIIWREDTPASPGRKESTMEGLLKEAKEIQSELIGHRRYLHENAEVRDDLPVNHRVRVGQTKGDGM